MKAGETLNGLLVDKEGVLMCPLEKALLQEVVETARCVKAAAEV
jgi:hypothetical protein